MQPATQLTGQTRFHGHIVDVVAGEIFPGLIEICDGNIASIQRTPTAPPQWIMPGLIDAHIHIESTMLPPSEFSRLATVHGTVATISDPHEIANVLGMEGIRYMIEDGQRGAVKFYFGAPSCVPATCFESAGATMDAGQIGQLLQSSDIHYLSEMMNFPGVIHGDAEVMKKIALAAASQKPVDGHAPGLRGKDVATYIAAGITTDHECTTLAEAREKMALGMHILIREGSAAKNFNDLAPLIQENYARCMLCSDDLHPDDLVKGHINLLVKRALALGFEPMHVLRCASLHPVRHYHLDVGLLQAGDPADFIIVDNLDDFNVLSTCINGTIVAAGGASLLPCQPATTINHFLACARTAADFRIPAAGSQIEVMVAMDGQVFTRREVVEATVEQGEVVADIPRDLLKIAVINRYQSDAKPAVAIIRGFGLRRGAIASTVAHDSHHIIATGTSDAAICKAVNMLVREKGGICAVDDDSSMQLPLPIAGLMSDRDGYQVARRYAGLNRFVHDLGCPLSAPFMTLSFMALLVIPALKLSDKGLFDSEHFAFTPLWRC
ncbi:adenine deaminase [Mariprofundus erugo]|uniref:adenine deaminase n=1 Tax=Mariprofundus erugo TaxID=2528639 RepID=UPI0010FDFEEA|nr:adenine deaminase [Mariprofundus erugo]TLS76006.1 adenine deaminase [Mariprofundus erugo]